MTPKEAKKLNPGDRVLIEAIIRDHAEGIIDDDGDVRISLEVAGGEMTDWTFIKPKAIREKIAPARRAFKKGDIVKWNVPQGYIFVVEKDEDEKGIVLGNINAPYRAENLILVCPVEDRHDRKEAK